MEIMKFEKVKLLEILKENRAKHRQIFEEACDGYKKKAIALLEEKLASAKAGERIVMQFALQQPVDQTREYDRAIRMLELSTDQVVPLDENDFSCYVMDEWAWRAQFLSSNSAYSGMAASMLAR